MASPISRVFRCIPFQTRLRALSMQICEYPTPNENTGSIVLQATFYDPNFL